MHAGWLAKLVYFFVVTQLTIFTVTLYLHRSQTHRGVDFHPVLAHFFRFWSWLSTGMVTKEWVAIHRKHHAKCETEEDPHSPKFFGIKTVLLEGVDLYRVASFDATTMDKYGKGTPDDWIERHLYAKHAYWGPTLTFIVNHRPVRHLGRRDFRAADDLDSVLGRRRGQWPRPLVGLSQFRNRRHVDQSHAVGFLHRRRRAAQQPSRISEFGRSSRCASSSSISAGSRSACSRCWAWPRCCASRRARCACRTCSCRIRKRSRPWSQPSLRGDDRLFPRRDRADPARGSREAGAGLRRFRARCARRSATAAAGSTSIRASVCSR